jgi:hypothetical protein
MCAQSTLSEQKKQGGPVGRYGPCSARANIAISRRIITGALASRARR